MDKVPSWPELLALMTEPSDEPTMTGVIVEVPGAEDGNYELVDALAVGAPQPAPDDPDEAARSWRVRRDGARFRLDRVDGSPLSVVGRTHAWHFEPGSPTPTRTPHGDEYASDPTGLLERRQAHDFLGNDFTRPTGPARAVTVLDRPAWEVELAPPPHKPAPMQVVVDAATGLLLERRNDAFGWSVRWTELAWGEPIEEDVFVWDGRFLDLEDLHEKLESEHAQDLAQRRAWFREQVTAEPIRVPVTVDVIVHEHAEDGSFEGFLDGVDVQMARRPLGSPGTWDLDWHEPGLRWVDDRWEWALLGLRDDTSAETFFALQRQLSIAPAPQAQPDPLVQVELSQDERRLLVEALTEWGGPAYGTEEVAHGIGFASLSALYEGAPSLCDAIRDRRPLTPRDWTRALLATEIAFASDVVGAAGEWEVIRGDDADERDFRVLRRVRSTLSLAGVIDRRLIGTDDTL